MVALPKHLTSVKANFRPKCRILRDFVEVA
jgi:hypothetical protein